ncbi:PrsW family intramembrane metalloprotease [Corynebacterium anserum]|uniref:PrsW family intramembrane metalloprotease n=1 Tax=Corynebacterium anserum TaxID=2684406 RepID=A0A7G7YLJ6_9CORY|nr:PrsW family intramembrane metalloprotease [Corynebacterium anserum]QNH95366.1 PrsW family intramembrane metalloprotease [Corynebacterium anserum]
MSKSGSREHGASEQGMPNWNSSDITGAGQNTEAQPSPGQRSGARLSPGQKPRNIGEPAVAAGVASEEKTREVSPQFRTVEISRHGSDGVRGPNAMGSNAAELNAARVNQRLLHPGGNALPKAASRWVVIHTPANFYKSFPAQARPRLKLFKDYWFWVYLVLTIPSAGMAVANIAFSGGGDALFNGSAVIAAGLGMIQVLVGVLGVLLLKISRGTPKRLIIMALCWGAFASPAIAGGLLSSPWLNVAEKMGWYASSYSLAAAVPEEMIKALGVFILLWIGRTWWNRPWHGLIAGLLVGTGFEVYENTLYAVNLAVIHPVSDVDGALQVYLTRVLLGPFLHMLMTGLAGYGIGRALYEGENWGRRKRVLNLIGWIGLAVALHYGWNFTTPGETVTAWELGVKAVLWLIMAGTVGIVVIREKRRVMPLMRAGVEPAVTIYQRG